MQLQESSPNTWDVCVRHREMIAWVLLDLRGNYPRNGVNQIAQIFRIAATSYSYQNLYLLYPSMM